MARWRKIVQDGNSKAVRLSSIDVKDFELKIGDEVDIEVIVLERKIRRKKK